MCIVLFIPCLRLAFEEQAPETSIHSVTPVLAVVAIFILSVLVQRFE